MDPRAAASAALDRAIAGMTTDVMWYDAHLSPPCDVPRDVLSLLETVEREHERDDNDVRERQCRRAARLVPGVGQRLPCVGTGSSAVVLDAGGGLVAKVVQLESGADGAFHARAEFDTARALYEGSAPSSSSPSSFAHGFPEPHAFYFVACSRLPYAVSLYEKVPGVTLDGILEDVSDGTLAPEVGAAAVRGARSALVDLAERGFFHRDANLYNFIVDVSARRVVCIDHDMVVRVGSPLRRATSVDARRGVPCWDPASATRRVLRRVVEKTGAGFDMFATYDALEEFVQSVEYSPEDATRLPSDQNTAAATIEHETNDTDAAHAASADGVVDDGDSPVALAPLPPDDDGGSPVPGAGTTDEDSGDNDGNALPADPSSGDPPSDVPGAVVIVPSPSSVVTTSVVPRWASAPPSVSCPRA